MRWLSLEERRLSYEVTVLDDDGALAAAVDAALGGDHAGLVGHRLPDHEAAVLEDGEGVAEDEVDGAGDGAVAVVLAIVVCVETVLVAVDVHIVEDGAVAGDAQGHALMPLGTRRVLESDVLCQEVFSVDSCKRQ